MVASRRAAFFGGGGRKPNRHRGEHYLSEPSVRNHLSLLDASNYSARPILMANHTAPGAGLLR